MKLQLSRIIASLFYLGFVPGMPGTYSSIITALVFYSVYSLSGRIAPELHLSAVCLISLVGVLVSAEIGRSTGKEDPSYIVIDEAAGQLLTFLLVPVTGWNIFLGILAFRTFDIWKPYPIRKLERLGRGVGVMADDLLAGIYGNIALHIINLLL
ncbi:MAG: phosphatidylglycerophosphatase A [Acidobacteria bacterium]|nr:phosphatidylglycerophosphatase A [Acidobacteriota bacterium]